MNEQINGDVENKFTIILEFDRKVDDYFIVYRTDEGRVNYHISPRASKIANLFMTLQKRVQCFRMIFSYFMELTMVELLRFNGKYGIDNVKDVCKLKKKRNRKKKK